ncbi:hypothetical protein J4457_06000 [Candidatus Woesearchaeota archaeon]|nr:hypothetical protein [Candidatus Woesearchaeota archaeon]
MKHAYHQLLDAVLHKKGIEKIEWMLKTINDFDEDPLFDKEKFVQDTLFFER